MGSAPIIGSPNLPLAAGVKAGHERRRVADGVRDLAARASTEERRGFAHLASLEVLEAIVELGREGLEGTNLAARLFELVLKELANPRHRHRAVFVVGPVREDRADLRQRKTERLELVDPRDAKEDVFAVDAVPTLGPNDLAEQADLLVQSDRPR